MCIVIVGAISLAKKDERATRGWEGGGGRRKRERERTSVANFQIAITRVYVSERARAINLLAGARNIPTIYFVAFLPTVPYAIS